ncbi:MAG: Gfo/Idh/MocA family oxidoreductase [Candidatus Marinimicrobia bacterium]|jgi:UDP-2-acetamido-3-amino-2,3-dideoxy-glucuronate N-acetyltransferase|nr:Gfo/Idh/MocA family oxidoreductase [Candidatus Neomarinimicrobiota bacterium]MBT3496337.1 Gfo/Idh/MocA family oxidoreductase [Candidatus Neomarinimicrobiota bacterium]MBT4145039.1 Gfo/Idh/MocA family oxidoreductase [Candidatus Neomarinimicrobiota bacterium]MBT4178451.1 Gfo/Idh/MocA family oxidoreductase [Candidatus Neomarinimicrobiota bacterium]MBT4593259.1 Gfo/Idh/MocA family oxidoreductase [Candidatus Neomarinimicrobiota bacterium]
MSNKTVCVIGAGYWGKNHIRTLYELGNLGGIVESNSETLKRFAEQYPDVKGYLSLGDALQDGQFSGFTVATPAETHFPLAKQIMEAGKHVLVEKPLTLQEDHAEELVRLSEENNVNIMVGHVLLFHPAIKKIKGLIDSGKIGKLQYIYSNRLNLGQVRTEENVFWSLAPHDISIFQYFTDAFPEAIHASGSTFLQKGIHDSTLTQFKYPNGVEGHIFVSWLHPFKEHRLVVIGSEAMITFEDSSEGKPLKLYAKKFDMAKGVPEKIDGPVTLIDYEQKMALTEELQYFVDHLEGKKPNIANGNHALEVMKILIEASQQLTK